MLKQMEMKYITDLLYDHDCVIIPGFGGFVSSYASATINRDKNHFKPPFKKILFNCRLKSNDGILANYIAQQESISYTNAMNLIRRFVDKSNKEMDADKKIRFRGIGLLYKDENGNLQFEQDASVNYLSNAFGLSAFNSPTIYRKEGAKRFERTIKDSPEVALRSRKWMKGLKWAAVLVPLLAVGTWGFFNQNMLKQKYDQYAIYFSPITGEEEAAKATLSQSELEQQIREKKSELDNFELNQSSFVPTTSDSEHAAELAKETEPEQEISEEVQPEKKQQAEQVTQPGQSTYSSARWKYQIITGSFLSERNARDHFHQLEELGFSPQMAGKNSYGYYRVAATGSKQRSEALNRLRLIKEEDYSDAWLLVE